MIKNYIKKPVIIEALQWTGGNCDEIIDFMGMQNIVEILNNNLIIRTLEGNMTASKNDYIIKGVHGEFYPCKPDIFLETYDMVEN